MDQHAPDEAANLYAQFALKGRRSTRVIDIQPATSWQEPVEADMRIIEIPRVSEDMPFQPSEGKHEGYRRGSRVADYCALSYTWGSLQKDKTIYVNRRALCVTSNLNNALQILRGKREVVTGSMQFLSIKGISRNGVIRSP